MKQRFRSGGLAAWSIQHPVGISMLALTIVVLGLVSLTRLNIDLLPHIIYPNVNVRVVETGVSAKIMEDTITRQLEEQLAITEGATRVQSRTSEGRSAVDLSFPYGTDIDAALRDASNRLDRAKRFLPETIEPPIIYKRDPSQIPVMEMVLSSLERDAVELRSWADYIFSRWFLNLPGVAAVEVGGGLEREIQLIADQEKMASIGLTLTELADIIRRNNEDAPGGRMINPQREITARTHGRFETIEEIRSMPLSNEDTVRIDSALQLGDVADVVDGHENERIRIRLNGEPGVKVSIQKLPRANTVSVVDEVHNRLDFLKRQGVIPQDISVATVGDQSTYVRHALNNASLAALSGAVLAMLVIYLFLGSLVRTLIIGTAIPIGILVTFSIMEISGLTLNIMTLGGLALGMGLLIDSTIVMLENIARHQSDAGTDLENAVTAAREVNSPIIASTGTNLAAILPFLFVSGLTGLLFRELIITITSAMLAALLVALTLVPALGSRVRHDYSEPGGFDRLLQAMKRGYHGLIRRVLRYPVIIILLFTAALAPAVYAVYKAEPIFLPAMDDGSVTLSIRGDAGISLNEMDATVDRIESLLLEQPEVVTAFTTVGGFVFGRSEFENSNRSSINVQLVPVHQRDFTSNEWTRKIREKIDALKLTGYTVHMWVRGVRGIRLGSGDDDVSLRIQGPDMEVLRKLGDEVSDRIETLAELKNVEHSYEVVSEELNVRINRKRAADLGINADDIGQALRIALDGSAISSYIEGDRQFDIRLRLPRSNTRNPERLGSLLVGLHQDRPVRLYDIATISRGAAPKIIHRDQQQRIVEISASLVDNASLATVMEKISERLRDLDLPSGYYYYDGGAGQTLQEGQTTARKLLALAVFLVYVVLAVQYESLRNPLVILLSVPFGLIGVSLGLALNDMPLSMPVWLGLIMLAGIVVNNAIVLVEQIEIEREKDVAGELEASIAKAASLRLRPVLMTTLTTVLGMTPLALGLGEGAEMLQPLAFVIVWGLSFSMLVSLVMVPCVYRVLHRHRPA